MSLPESWRGRACVVYGVADGVSRFAPEELAALGTDKRRNEWMLSRIAEKQLRGRGVSGPHVSYSHSGRYGAAAIDRAPVGIDLEVLRDLSPRAAHLFLAADEEAAASDCPIANALLHFWCAKEARWKQLGGAIATLKRVPLRLLSYDANGCTFDCVATVAVDDVIVALTRPIS